MNVNRTQFVRKVTRKGGIFEEDFDDYVRKKYNLDKDAFMNMNYQERNKKLY